jgi:hypothetical protein
MPRRPGTLARRDGRGPRPQAPTALPPRLLPGRVPAARRPIAEREAGRYEVRHVAATQHRAPALLLTYGGRPSDLLPKLDRLPALVIEPPTADIHGHMHTRPPKMGQQHKRGPRGKDRLADARHDSDHRCRHHLPRLLAAAWVRRDGGLPPWIGSPAPAASEQSAGCLRAHPGENARGVARGPGRH